MSGPPFTMSKYATELDLLRDKCVWQEARIAELEEQLERGRAFDRALSQAHNEGDGAYRP